MKGWVLPVLILSASCYSRTQGFGELSRLSLGKTDKLDTHGFTEIYEHIFSPLRPLPIRICEIGIGRGGSLVVWGEYFSKATVFGIDMYTLTELRTLLRDQGVKEDFLPSVPESDRLKTFVADQANRDQLKAFISKYGGDFDIVLDDGGHKMDQQQVSFAFFFRHIKAGGYYVIEDVHTSLTYGAQVGEANTTLSMIEHFIRNAQIKSQYLTAEEIEYLNRNIEYCNLFYRNNSARSMTCIFKKIR